MCSERESPTRQDFDSNQLLRVGRTLSAWQVSSASLNTQSNRAEDEQTPWPERELRTQPPFSVVEIWSQETGRKLCSKLDQDPSNPVVQMVNLESVCSPRIASYK